MQPLAAVASVLISILPFGAIAQVKPEEPAICRLYVSNSTSPNASEYRGCKLDRTERINGVVVYVSYFADGTRVVSDVRGNVYNMVLGDAEENWQEPKYRCSQYSVVSGFRNFNVKFAGDGSPMCVFY